MDEQACLRRNRKWLYAILGSFALLWLATSIISHDPIDPVCVRLPNGMLLAPEARIHLLRGSFEPGILILDANGTELNGIGASGFSFSHTTAIWFDPNRPEESVISMVRLAYRPDVDLVSRATQGRLFREVRDSFGERLEVPDERHFDDSDDVWAQLKDNPSYRDETCEIPLFSWTKSESSYR